ncbi:hypothetical protein CI610_00260 [invertebrate metagenome]|uniref:Uncharacterized protein n=1 Tax=invertebrate metagenome TaxID=1711999 RepID=A0A2H9TC00_9ZZZZ
MIYSEHMSELVMAVQGGATNTLCVLFRYSPKTLEFHEIYRDYGSGSSLNHVPA